MKFWLLIQVLWNTQAWDKTMKEFLLFLGVMTSCLYPMNRYDTYVPMSNRLAKVLEEEERKTQEVIERAKKNKLSVIYEEEEKANEKNHQDDE